MYYTKTGLSVNIIKNGLPQIREPVSVNADALKRFDFVNLIGIRVNDVDPAGNTGIKGMNRSQDLKRFLGVCNRRADQGFFHRTQFAVGIPRAEVPGRRHHVLVVFNLLIFNLDPVPEGTSGNVV